MNELTKKITLPSGVECVHKEMVGKHQRILTQNDGRQFSEKLSDMIKDLIVSIGDETNITDSLILDLLSADKKALLVSIRQFSIDDNIFKFTWKYVDRYKKEQELEKTADLSEGFNIRPYAFQCSDYKSVNEQKRVEGELPRSGMKFRVHLLDGHGEKTATMYKKSDMSSHTALLLRRPMYFAEPKDETKNGTWVSMDVGTLDKLSIKDIEHLRTVVKNSEGQVDTEMAFEHPDAELKPQHEKMVIIDLLGEQAFFFPSEAI